MKQTDRALIRKREVLLERLAELPLLEQLKVDMRYIVFYN